MRRSAREDDFVDVEDVEIGFRDGFLYKTSEGGEDLGGEHFVAGAVDCGREI